MKHLRKQIDASKIPKGRFCYKPIKQLTHSKIELHLHLDGAVRVSTIWEMAKRKGISIGNTTSYEEIEEIIRVKRQASLTHFLDSFALFTPTIAGDADAIERCAYELCEDQARQGCSYFETRYSPQLWTSSGAASHGLTPDKVVEAVNSGLRRGEKDFGVKARSILCCILHRPEWSDDVLRLCKKYANDGVVAIDCAAGEPENNNIFDKRIVNAFTTAKELGIHRTCHAGEIDNSSKNVAFAVNEMFAERIGHGYHILDDPEIYAKYKHKVHFEVCPYSSFFTGAVTSSANNGKHAIIQFAEDNVSFSINKDDPTIIQTTLDDEYRYLTELGLTEVHFIRSFHITITTIIEK
ncbi:Adenosine deaminase-like protein [Leptotrombidium deliense]|uniref:adenosine deaminase n=1 Tax=Leptotrombidium deliense TaxID=299467 RepID=A0A443SCZ8_9ACAR|nr:Adenosine deaminase-like protein [Leptotrombidium deliense]